jgi:hypothetical protein
LKYVDWSTRLEPNATDLYGEALYMSKSFPRQIGWNMDKPLLKFVDV